MSILGVLRTGGRRGSGDAMYSTWKPEGREARARRSPAPAW